MTYTCNVANPWDVDYVEYYVQWKYRGDAWGSTTRAVAMIRRAMTAAGIAHEHVDDESLSRAVKESSPDILCLDDVAAWAYVLIRQEILNQTSKH
jgi:hypothetical protein